MKRFLAAALAALFVASPVLAQGKLCAPFDVAKEKIIASTLAYDVLSGDRLARAVEFLKSQGAPDDTDFVVMAVAANDQGEIALVLYAGRGNAICGKMQISDESMVKVFNHIYGYRA